VTFAYVLLVVGAILTLAGWFGPEDEGTLAIIGLALIGLAIYAAHKNGFPIPFLDD